MVSASTQEYSHVKATPKRKYLPLWVWQSRMGRIDTIEGVTFNGMSLQKALDINVIYPGFIPRMTYERDPLKGLPKN